MRGISFVKLSPTQNVTVFVTDDIPRAQQSELAAKLLAYDSVGGEQVGFLERPELPGARMRLQMMGGEFCGNASMSLGAWLAWKDGLAPGAQADYVLEVSGANEPVKCHIECVPEGYRGAVHMPLPEGFGEVRVQTDAGEASLPAVIMPGIVHLIARSEAGLTRGEVARRIRGWNDQIRADALGVLMYDEEAMTIAPIVYVPATDSAVWERGCGSGTAALGSWMAVQSGKSFCAGIRQPGGEIIVRAEVLDGKCTDVQITGTVRITASGTAYVE